MSETAGEDEFIRAAMQLREVNGVVWEGFVRAVHLYAAGVAREMVKCDPEHLLRAQGMAQMAEKFARTLQKAPELFENQRARSEGVRIPIPRTSPYRG